MKWAASKLAIKFPEDWYRVRLCDLYELGHVRFTCLGYQVVDLLIEAFPDLEFKEWLFDQAPVGFWDNRDNQLRYLAWLKDKLKLVKVDDWYHVSKADFIANRGGSLVNKHGSVIKTLKDLMPDHDWKEWLFFRPDIGFWRQKKNRLRYLEWFAKENGIECDEQWYNVTVDDFRNNSGGGFIGQFKDSAVAAICRTLPNTNFLPWKFTLVPKHFCETEPNRRRYVKWLAGELGFKTKKRLVSTNQSPFPNNYGGGLAMEFGSPFRILQKDFPEKKWIPWLFEHTEVGLFQQKENRLWYLDWLGKELKYKKPDDWYRLTQSDFYNHRGKSLFTNKIYRYPIDAIRERFPDRIWYEWLFPSFPCSFWKKDNNKINYLKWLEERIQLVDWNLLSRDILRQNYGGNMIIHGFKHSVTRVREFAKRTIG